MKRAPKSRSVVGGEVAPGATGRVVVPEVGRDSQKRSSPARQRKGLHPMAFVQEQETHYQP